MDHIKIFHPAESPDLEVHLTEKPIPELMRRYGLWLIGGTMEWKAQRNGYFLVSKRMFEFYSLSQMVGGAGYFSHSGNSGEPIPLSVGDVIVICPHDIHRYGGSADSVYMEDSLRFSGAIPDMLRSAGLLRTGVFHWGPLRTLREIIEMQQDPSVNSQLRAASELQRFLVELYLKSHKIPELSYMDLLLEKLRFDISRWWTVEEMSELCNVSTDKLRRDFVTKTGLLPKNYVESLKMRAAIGMLTVGGSVNETAHALGYRNPYHFSRRFRQFYGTPPVHWIPTHE